MMAEKTNMTVIEPTLRDPFLAGAFASGAWAEIHLTEISDA